MEYAKDEIFHIRYNTKLNRLQTKEERWTSTLYKKIKKHKLITTVIIAFLLFSIINIVMINIFIEKLGQAQFYNII